MIWTDASLELEGHGTFWKLGLLLGLCALAEPSDHVRLLPNFGLLLLSSDDVSSQEALLLWEQVVLRDD